MTRKEYFMASIDLTDAYYSAPIENSLQNSLRFNFKENFIVMHVYLMVWHLLQEFLLKSHLSTVGKLGYVVMNYLDDIFICGDTVAECRDAVLATANLLLKLGFCFHQEKSQLIPVQKIEYLGFLIDSFKMKTSLTKIKQDKLKLDCWSFKQF